MSIVCPIDKKDDAIQSVPGVISNGVSWADLSGPSGGVTFIDGKTGYTAGSSHLSGTISSNLAQSLSSPIPPNEPKFWSLVGWSVVFFFSSVTIVGPFFVWKAFKNNFIQDIEKQKITFPTDFSILSGFLLYIFVIPHLWPFIPIWQKSLRSRLDFDNRYKKWLDIYKNWQKLYYCHRCNVVFNPETGEHFPPNQLNEYLHVYEYV